MANIAWLRKLAAAVNILGWCYIVVVPIGNTLFWPGPGARREWLPELRPLFPWDWLTLGILKNVAIGAALLVLAQFVLLGIRALEHLRSVDEGEEPEAQPEPEPEAEETEEMPAETLGQRILNLPGRFPSAQFLAKGALVLGLATIGLTAIITPSILRFARVRGLPGIGAGYIISTFGRTLTVGLAAGVGLLLLSETVFWAQEAVGHLKNLAEAEYDEDEGEVEEKAE